MMKRWFLPIILVILSLSSVQAKKYTLSKLLYERDQYQEGLQEELQSRIEAVVPKTHFILKTEVVPKVIYDRPKSVVQPDVYIGKLGMAAPIGPKKLKKKRIFRSNFRDNIRKIKVKVILDDTVEASKEGEVQQIVKTLVTLVHPSRLEFDTSRMVIVGEKKEVVFQAKIDKVNSFLGKNRTLFFTFIGLSMALGLFFAFTYSVRRSTQTIGKAGERILNFLENIHRIDVKEAKKIKPQAPAPAVEDEDDLKKLEEVQRELAYFIKSANERPIRMSLLVNQWIHDRPHYYEEGVALIPHLVEHEVFGEVMRSLSEDTRQALSKIIGKNFSSVNIERGKEFIQSHLPFMFQSEEENPFEKIVLSMTSEECIEVIKREPDLGSLVIHSLPQEKSESVLKKLPESMMGILIDSSLKTDVSEPVAERRLKELVEAIRKDKVSSIPPTFLAHIIKQLKEVSPEREKGIFQMFRDSERTEVLYYISKEVFPSELILKLPSTIIKLVLSSFSLEAKAKILFSCPKDSREKLKLQMCEPDSREERFLNLEIQKIETSPAILADIKERSGEIWREFAHAVRRYLQTNEQAEKDARMVLEKWIYHSQPHSEGVESIKKVA
jgi:hypothetical protein